MTASRIAFAGILGVGCLVASGVGGYLAVRSETSSAAAPPAAAVAGAVDDAAPEATPSGEARAFTETAARPAPASRPPSRSTRTDAAPVVSPPVARVSEPDVPAAALTPTPAPTIAGTTPVSEPFPAGGFTAAELEPAPRTFTLPSDSVIGIRLDADVSSETAQLEDPVRARVTRDVLVGGETVIPAGAALEGSVTLVEPGGRFRDQARVGILFSSLRIDDMRFRIETESIYRDGEPPTGEATAKIGAGAVIGTIVGAMIGGKKGAAIGGGAGAAGGTAAVMTGDRNPALIAAGTPLTVRLTSPLTVHLVAAR